MSRQANLHEKFLFDVIREYNNKFYYENINKESDTNSFKVKIEKKKEEMIGKAYVTLPDGARVDYELRYNRIINLSEGYTLLVTGSYAS